MCRFIYISNARKLQFCKQPFEIIQEQIALNTVQCVNKQTVVLLMHPVFWRAGRAFFGASGERWLRAILDKVWNESIMYPRGMKTGSKEREGGGERKSLAYERGSVRGERSCYHMHRKRNPDDYEEAFSWCISRTNKEISLKKKQGYLNLQTF